MFEHSEKSSALQDRLSEFMHQHIYPNEKLYLQQRDNASPRFSPLPLVEELKALAKEQDLWNLFVPPEFKHPEPV